MAEAHGSNQEQLQANGKEKAEDAAFRKIRTQTRAWRRRPRADQGRTPPNVAGAAATTTQHYALVKLVAVDPGKLLEDIAVSPRKIDAALWQVGELEIEARDKAFEDAFVQLVKELPEVGGFSGSICDREAFITALRASWDGRLRGLKAFESPTAQNEAAERQLDDLEIKERDRAFTKAYTQLKDISLNKADQEYHKKFLEKWSEHKPKPGYLALQDSYTQVKKLLEVKQNPVYSAALELWDRKLMIQKNSLDIRDKWRADLINQVYNVVGFFSVFQGVVLTAVSQLAAGSYPKCGKVWIPSVLSVFTLLVASFAVHDKFKSIEKLEDRNKEDRAIRDGIRKKTVALEDLGKEFRFYNHAEIYQIKPELNSQLHYKAGVFVSLVLFTGILVLSYFVILCDKWENPKLN